MSTGEVIQIHIGQAGVQIANACWELYCLEHNINNRGCIKGLEDVPHNAFFSSIRGGKIIPRVIMVDTEPNVIDDVRNGPYRNLFHPATLITGKEDAGNNFFRGYFKLADELITKVMSTIRYTAESCSNLQGFLLFRSIGGGTGSGLGTKILEHLNMLYCKKTIMEFMVYPAPSISPVVVEPYNAILATHAGLEYSDCTFLLDNEAMFEIGSKLLDIDGCSYININRFIGQVVSTFTGPMRFEGPVNVKFEEFETNLVPYPKVHFPLVSYAPIYSKTKFLTEPLTAERLTLDVFSTTNHFIKCNPMSGKYMASSLLFRGNLNSANIKNAVAKIKTTIPNFVDWSPSGFKVGVNTRLPTYIPQGDLASNVLSCLMLANNTAIRKPWCRLLAKYQRLIQRKAYVFHYLYEGMQEDDIILAGETICSLVQAYREIEKEISAKS